MNSRLNMILALVGAALSFLAAPVEAIACHDLSKGLETAPNVRIDIAELVPAGSNFTGNTTNPSANINLTNLPAHCRVSAWFNTAVNNTVNFEVWLPVANEWNARLLTFGNGGWGGNVVYPDISRGLKQGFASMSCDTGHRAPSSDGVMFSDQEASIDFGHRALHLSVGHAKQIVNAFYEEPASWSYYSGCSTGGRQGFAEVQRYPDDFDGALIGAPVIWQTHLQAWENYVTIGQYPNTSDTFISTEQWTAIHNEAVRQCDTTDGLKDGLISDPTRCYFHPETLLCNKASTNLSACLTPPQLANLKTKYDPWVDTNNTLVYPGMSVGSELGGIQRYTNAPVGGGYGLSFFQYAILNDTSFTSTDITFADVQTAELINSYGAIEDAFSPNLTSFRDHGGKILHYHGWQDSVAPSAISPLYYSNVLDFFSEHENATSEDVSSFYRLFMVPGLQHCSSGDGAWVLGSASQVIDPPQNNSLHNALLALVEWTETDSAPDMLVGTRYTNVTRIGDTLIDDTVAYTRPICQWPALAEFQGDDKNNASNWVCPPSVFESFSTIE
ncbi:hypothetical protein PV10_06779 [Exophiala mesophila]|uniref:Carboxylic ester hydrolase n=1 Tax=Exophiala mesophila TaxID=212818 RepID=A0A0D1ZCA4_EXOME|nr:uncharacterized protein PV10_06779 [Exophiala mesophila]KIV92327.1 hypothetical protein PV10_06779 [Exophiala mesophila]